MRRRLLIYMAITLQYQMINKNAAFNSAYWFTFQLLKSVAPLLKSIFNSYTCDRLFEIFISTLITRPLLGNNIILGFVKIVLI